MKRGITCTRCGLPGYTRRAAAEAACIRKGCHVRGIYRCGDLYHFDATALLPLEER